jgi:hypothetical protein
VTSNNVCILPYTRPEILNEMPKHLRGQDIVTMRHNEVEADICFNLSKMDKYGNTPIAEDQIGAPHATSNALWRIETISPTWCGELVLPSLLHASSRRDREVPSL